MEVQGRVHYVGETLEVGSTTKIKKRELLLVIDEDQEYPQNIKLEVMGGRCEMFDGIGKGDIVTVKYRLEGRLYQKVNEPETAFNTLKAWQIVVNKAAGNSKTEDVSAPAEISSAPDDDDLPF